MDYEMDNEMDNEILKLILDESLSDEELRNKLGQYHESDIAEVVSQLSEEDQKKLFARLTVDEIGELLTYFESPEDVIEELDPSVAADIVETMDVDDAIDVLEDVDEEVAHDIISQMEEESRHDIELIQKFDEDEIGSKMTTNFITLKSSYSIKEAMRALIKEAPENDNIYNLFVLDEKDKYYGTIKLKDLIIAREGSPLESITHTEYPTLSAHDKVVDVINEIKNIDLDYIPVLSEDDRILGVITSQDIIETVDEEMTEDYVKFAAVDEEADTSDTLWQSVRRRFPWLAMLLILDILTSTVLSGFSGVIAVLPALVLFQSWILDTGGNAGTQSLALTIRSITANQITKKTFGKYFLKEFFTGLLNGLIVGAAGFLVSLSFLLISKNYVSDNGTFITQLTAAGIVGSSLLIAIPFTSLAGLFIPLLFKTIHVDPAVASGPLITTLSDMFGVAIYYTLAMVLFATLL